MERIVFGKLVNTHGVRGEVKILSQSDFKDERFKKGTKFYVGDKEVTVKTHRTHKNFDLVTFEEYTNINEVETLKGLEVSIDKSMLSELPEDEFYYHDLEGLSVFNGEELVGEVSHVRDMPNGALLEVKTQSGKKLIPFVDEFIEDVDLEEKKIFINVIEGLL